MKVTPELSPGARRVMARAKSVARDYKHDFITTEHVLLGILERERPTTGVSLMRELEVDVDKFKSFVISICSPTSSMIKISSGMSLLT